MKRLIGLLTILLIASCDINSSTRGPEGPPGPAGPVGQGFEVEADFTAGNGYSEFFAFPNNVEVLDTDIVIVYWLFGVDDETGNDIWQQLPATVYFNDGQFQYAFDHTWDDVQIFLQGNIDLGTLGSGYRQDQIFRVAILPVDYVQGNNIDVENIKMEEMMDLVGKDNFEKMKLN